MRAFFAYSFLVLFISPLFAHELSFETGLLKNAITPSADFGSVVYKHEEFRVGAFTSPSSRGVLASYSAQSPAWVFDVGQREASLEQGFLIGNGAYLPWSKNFVFKEPTGIRTGYNAKYLGVSTAYYQYGGEGVALAEAALNPTRWLSISGGATQSPSAKTSAEPVFSLGLGSKESRQGFHAALTFQGNENRLLYAGYSGSIGFRFLAFQAPKPSSLASGIYAQKEGGAVQFFSERWFAQFFQTESQFGMVRYGGDFLTLVFTKEDKASLLGFSFRTNPKSFHARAGATFGADGSTQTLVGLGFADAIFIGGGSYTVYRREALEPIIFPASWYSSVLLQSTSMRIENTGFKMMALVDTEPVEGFIAVTHSTDARGREKFIFFARIAGRIVF
ncbi:MAG: hypothetical protein LDLANPLL_00590 [Turneriella sp.]|nr:hypothetical protein [Turneriella sp.]